MVKLANPFYYPLAVFFGGVSLFVGVRLVRLPSLVMLPVAAGVTVAGASFLKSRKPQYLELNNPELEREINHVKASALALVNQVNDLRTEAKKSLTDTFQLELLAGIEISGDRLVELPGKIDNLVWNINGNNSLLSADTLQQQLQEVKQKLQSSSGVAKQHWQQLSESLQRNIKLSKEGEDTRIARIINISTLIQDAAGLLQRLQTKLRNSDLTDSEQINGMILLTDELNSLTENLDLLVHK